MPDRAPTLSDAIDLGTALHDEDVQARLRRREERNRARLSQLNHQPPDEAPVAAVAPAPVPISSPEPEPIRILSQLAPHAAEPIEPDASVPWIPAPA